MDKISIDFGKRSKWEFNTSSTGSLGAGFFAGEGGKIYLNDPQGVMRTFTYGTVGVGLSAGLKLPKIGKVDLNGLTGTLAPASFPNTGSIYLSQDFKGDDLTADDIRGVCAIAEVAGGFVGGGSASAICLGVSEKWFCAGKLQCDMPLDFVQARLIETARAYLFVAGLSVGFQFGGGVSGMIGYLG